MDVTANKSRKKQVKLEELSKEQIRQAILRKKECNATALKIVESLMEEGVSDSYLLQCLPDINQAHFDDIIEERSILRLCGYPICQHPLSAKGIPKQKYRISLKTNKVYDITTRKNFCSNSCYRSAMYVKQQMLTSPLWFREHEVIPTFHLLPLDTTGTMGQEVDLGVERVQIKSEKPFTSINDFADASLKDMSHKDAIEGKNEIVPEICIEQTPEQPTKIENQNIAELNKGTSNMTSGNLVEEIVKAKTPTSNPMNIVGEIIEKAERKIDPILVQEPKPSINTKPKKVAQKKDSSIIALTIEVEKCLAQWFTLDTMLFLFGEEKVRELVADKGECISEYLNNYTKGIFYNSIVYDHYQQLCKKLNMLELEDKRNDAKTLQRDTKPLPDYSVLQEESKRMQLRVQAFLAGETEAPEPEETKIKSPTDDDANLTQLPLVDKNAQNALRRRIVCQHLNKVLPDLLRSLGLLAQMISSDVRLLVNTFQLKANNIMFKPVQWTLIALIFVKLLSIRDKHLERLLEVPMAYQHMQLLLLSYKLDGGYLDRLILWLTDIDRLFDTKDTQLTLE